MTDTITLDVFVKEKQIPPVIDYVQGTNAVSLVFVFRDWEIPSGAEARIYIKKPSGNEVYNSASVSGNTVTVKPTTQMFAEAGTQEGQIQILSGEDILATFLLDFCVERNIVSESAIESNNEYGTIDQLIADLQGYVQNAASYAAAAESAKETCQEIVDESGTADILERIGKIETLLGSVIATE